MATNPPGLFKAPFYVFISILLSLLAGCFDGIGMLLGLSRTIYFLPFFLLGHYFACQPKGSFDYLKTPKIYPIIVLSVSAGILFAFRDLPEQWLYGNAPYSSLDSSFAYGIAIRSAIYLISILSTLSILALVSSRESPFSRAGRRSLIVYLWHGFVVLALAKLGVHY